MDVKLFFKLTMTKSYKTETKTFESVKAWDDWFNSHYKDESYRKIINFEILNNNQNE